MDVKSDFLHGTIDEEVYVSQPLGFVDPKFPNKVKQKEDGIFIIQDKYVVEILKKFDFLSVKTSSTPIETQNPLVRDEEAADVDVHLYRSMIGSLMYLTASRPDIVFAACACSRDAYEKKVIQVLKIHIDDNVADLLTKDFDVSRWAVIAMVKQKEDGIFIIQDKFVVEIIKKLDFLSVKTSSTPIETQNPLVRDEEAADVDVLGYSKDFTSSSCEENLWGRKNAKLRQTKVDSDKLDYELDEDMEYLDAKEALNEGRLSTVDIVRPDVSTARPDVCTARQELSTADKGKGVFEEPKSAKKMYKSDFDDAQIVRDEEIATQMEVELQAEEKYTVDERAKLLAEYFERRKKQLAEERAATIRNKPPTKTQLRSLMMTYLKNIGRFTHSQLNKKSFKDIQGLYIKEQELIADFIPIGSEEDVRMIRDMNKKAEEESIDKGVDSTNKKKEESRMKRMSKREKTDVDLEEVERLKTFMKIDPDEEEVIDYEVLDKRFPIIN
nr:uncharacterized mitochondrial protein AtMg00810-like [Tanacetum cinerariifolium]